MRPPGDHAGPEHVPAHFHTDYSICTYFIQNNSLTESSVASYVMVFMYVCNKKETVCPGLCATKGSGGVQGVKQTVCVCWGCWVGRQQVPARRTARSEEATASHASDLAHGSISFTRYRRILFQNRHLCYVGFPSAVCSAPVCLRR